MNPVGRSNSVLRWLALLPTLVLGALVGACADPGGESVDCNPGSAGCECFNGQCLPGLVCSGNLCLGSSGETGGDGDPTTGDPTTTGGDGDPECASGKNLCNGSCVDLDSNPDHCGACNSPCEGSDLCVDGQCLTNIDCSNQECPGLSYCDLITLQCKPGCAFDSQCDSGFVCDLVDHTCHCPADEQLCDGSCIPDWDSCESCGNGVVDPDEQCDGNNLGGVSCLSLGYEQGSVVCDGCELDTSACTNAPQPGLGQLYSHCLDSSQCPGMDGCATVTMQGQMVPFDGFCTNYCDSDADCYLDVGGTAIPQCNTEVTPYCELDCAGNKTCPGGMVCIDLQGGKSLCY